MDQSSWQQSQPQQLGQTNINLTQQNSQQPPPIQIASSNVQQTSMSQQLPSNQGQSFTLQYPHQTAGDSTGMTQSQPTQQVNMMTPMSASSSQHQQQQSHMWQPQQATNTPNTTTTTGSQQMPQIQMQQQPQQPTLGSQITMQQPATPGSVPPSQPTTPSMQMPPPSSQPTPTVTPAPTTTLAPSIAPIGSSVPPMKQRLQDLVNEVDPDEQLDEDVEEVLLDIADEFIENVVSSACAIAKHRGSTSLEVDDVKLYLERKYKIWIPGFGESKPPPKRFTSEAHRQRMALINRQENRASDDANKSQKSK